MSMLFQFFITAIWAALLINSTRRLLRLAHVEQLQRWGRIRLRSGLNRVWWWLGQHEVGAEVGYALAERSTGAVVGNVAGARFLFDYRYIFH